MNRRPLLSSSPVDGNEAENNARSTPHLELVQGSGKAAETPQADRVDRSDELARLGIIIQQIGAAEILARLNTENYKVPVEPMRGWARGYINHSIKMLQTKATIANKSGALERFFWWLDEHGYAECGKEEVEEFLDHVTLGHQESSGRWGRGNDASDPESARFVKPVSAHAIKFYRDHLRAFFKWAVSKNYIVKSPVEGVVVPKPKKALKQPFTAEQVDALIRAARKSEQPRRDEAIYVFLYDTGLRATELCNMRLADLEFNQKTGGQVKVLGKGDKWRLVPFGRRARTLLTTYLEQAPRNGADKVFIAEKGWKRGEGLQRNGLRQMFERHGLEAGIIRRGDDGKLIGVRCSPHTMRHTFAINFLRRGGDIRTLSYIMGHETLEMTRIYLNIAEADAENQHAKYSPADGLGD